MINLETRKKLKELGLFKNTCDCPYEDDGGCDRYDCSDYPLTADGCRSDDRCNVCLKFLPDPTTDELIEAIDEKHKGCWGIEKVTKDVLRLESWRTWFKEEMRSSFVCTDRCILSERVGVINDLNECLATALIWLYEEEE